jgi:ribosomal protein S18 acetylase RimI-like enzyme
VSLLIEDRKFRFLSDADFIPLHHAFLKAFSDYQVNMNVSEQRFRDRLVRDGVTLPRSVGAFAEKELVGFSLNGYGRWQGRLTAYDAGTGILPTYRSRGLGRDLFGYMMPELKKAGVEQCLLEVLSTNLPALKLYRKLGFSETRTFAVCQQTKIVARPVLDQIELHDVDVPDWRLYQTFWDGEPSWQNSIDAIERMTTGKEVVGAYLNNECIGYGVISTITGNVMQLAVSPAYRRKGVGSALLDSLRARLTPGEPLRVTNIDCVLTGTLAFFEACGFSQVLQQLEMIMDL